MPRMGKTYRENFGDCPMTPQEKFNNRLARADRAEKYVEQNCSETKLKGKVFLKFSVIKRIEESNISEEEKKRRLKNLYPKDTCWHKFVDSEY